MFKRESRKSLNNTWSSTTNTLYAMLTWYDNLNRIYEMHNLDYHSWDFLEKSLWNSVTTDPTLFFVVSLLLANCTISQFPVFYGIRIIQNNQVGIETWQTIPTRVLNVSPAVYVNCAQMTTIGELAIGKFDGTCMRLCSTSHMISNGTMRMPGPESEQNSRKATMAILASHATRRVIPHAIYGVM